MIEIIERNNITYFDVFPRCFMLSLRRRIRYDIAILLPANSNTLQNDDALLENLSQVQYEGGRCIPQIYL